MQVVERRPSAAAWGASPGRRSARELLGRRRRGRARAAGAANWGSTGTARGTRCASSAIRAASVAATSLKARYCSSRANSRSRASSRARSSSSSTSACGSSRAALRSSSVAATSEELAGLVEVPVRAAGADVGDELVGDLGEGDLGDVELVLGDQAEQQVEGALEDVEVDLEAAPRPARAADRAPGRRAPRRRPRAASTAGLEGQLDGEAGRGHVDVRWFEGHVRRRAQAASPRAMSSRASRR